MTYECNHQRVHGLAVVATVFKGLMLCHTPGSSVPTFVSIRASFRVDRRGCKAHPVRTCLRADSTNNRKPNERAKQTVAGTSRKSDLVERTAAVDVTDLRPLAIVAVRQGAITRTAQGFEPFAQKESPV